jgi:hypothetical protein
MTETIQGTVTDSQPHQAPQQQDYFGFHRTEKYYLPDGVSYIEFKPMNEGEKKNFQDKTSKDLVLERTGGARMSILQGTERHELIKACVVGWNLTRNGEPLPQPTESRGKIHFNDFLTLADPIIVEGLEKEIRKANPWLMAEMKVEDIDREIQNLQEMREVAVKREAGEAS